MPAGEPRRALGTTLIRRSAWKGGSLKFICRILHRTTSEDPENGFFGPSRHAGGDYMLWWCIKIRASE
jgi:hypothetical protein